MSGQLTCPKCGREFEAAASIEGDFTPAAGDVSICLSCCAIAIFTGDGRKVRGSTQVERDEALRLPIVRRTLLTIASYQAYRQRPGGV